MEDDLPIKNKGREIAHHEQVKEGNAEEMGKDVFLKLNLHAGVQRIEPQIKEFGGKAMPGAATFLWGSGKENGDGLHSGYFDHLNQGHYCRANLRIHYFCRK